VRETRFILKAIGLVKLATASEKFLRKLGKGRKNKPKN